MRKYPRLAGVEIGCCARSAALSIRVSDVDVLVVGARRGGTAVEIFVGDIDRRPPPSPKRKDTLYVGWRRFFAGAGYLSAQCSSNRNIGLGVGACLQNKSDEHGVVESPGVDLVLGMTYSLHTGIARPFMRISFGLWF